MTTKRKSTHVTLLPKATILLRSDSRATAVTQNLKNSVLKMSHCHSSHLLR